MRGRKQAVGALANAGIANGRPPECPPHLDEEARAEWARIVKLLKPLGILAKVDRTALAAYCSAWARWVHAEKKLQETDAVVRGSQGNAVLNPWLSVSRAAVVQMKSFLSEFGLTPVARARMLNGQQRPSAADLDDL